MLGLYLALIDEPQEQEAFTRLYLKYRKLMHYAARKILRNDMLAEEAVQEAFIRIAKNFSKVGEVDSAATKRFVVVITENAAKTIWKKEYKNNNISLDADDDQTEALFSGNVTDEGFERDYIVDEILELPKMQRDTLYLYALYGYSYKEVANLLGISEAAVRKNVQRGRKTLATKVQSK